MPRAFREDKATSSSGTAIQSADDSASASPDENSPLVLRNEFKTVPIKCAAQSFRRTAFGRTAVSRLYHAGGALDRLDSTPNNFLFITATLPGDDVWCKWAIAENAHHIVNRLKAWLSKRQKNRLEFYVWEHQKRAALHIHYCVYVPDPKIRARIKEEFRAEWIRLLEAIGEDVGYSLFGRHSEKTFDEKLLIVRTEVEEVKFSVAKYLAGYVGGKADKHGKDKYYDWYPKRWWGVSRPLSKLIDDYSDEIVHTYSSKREWIIAYENFDHEYSASALTRKYYPHKVGEGRSLIFYHSPEIHFSLCLKKQMLKHPSKVHPNISCLIQQASVTMTSGRYILRSYPALRAKLSPQLVAYLEDVTWIRSLMRSTLSQSHVRISQLMYIELTSVLQSRANYAGFLQQMTELELMMARAHPYLEWNQYGWLKNPDDIPIALDKPQNQPLNSTI